MSELGPLAPFQDNHSEHSWLRLWGPLCLGAGLFMDASFTKEEDLLPREEYFYFEPIILYY